MSDGRPPVPAPEPDHGTEQVKDHHDDDRRRDVPRRPGTTEPTRLMPLLHRRQSPWLLVEVDGTPASYRSLLWALREAARREATVVAVGVLDEPDGDPFGSAPPAAARMHLATHRSVEAHLLRAIAETGVRGRSRCAVLSRPVLDALVAAERGGDLVFVRPESKTLLRHAVPRPPARRLARGA
jgi:nucleotide-binding universal stress UspA family protein